MEWRGESLLCWESLGDGEMQEVARINSARPGRFGGEEGKKFAAARKRPAFEVRVFPAPGRARRTGQPQPATGCTATTASVGPPCSLAVALNDLQCR
jgi:hypothetical protein